jgi:hypothetical protein
MNEAETRAEHIDPASAPQAGACRGQPHPPRVSDYARSTRG